MSTSVSKDPAQIGVTVDDLGHARSRTWRAFGTINAIRNTAMRAAGGGYSPDLLSRDLQMLWDELYDAERLGKRGRTIWPLLPRFWRRDCVFCHAGVTATSAHEFIVELAAQVRRTMTVGAAEAFGLDAGGDFACRPGGWLAVTHEHRFDFDGLAARKDRPNDFFMRVCQRLNTLPHYDSELIWAEIEMDYFRAPDRIGFPYPCENGQPPAKEPPPWPPNGWWVGRGQAAYDGNSFPISGRNRELLELFVRHANRCMTVTVVDITAHCGQKVRGAESVKAEVHRLRQWLQENLGLSEDPIPNVDTATWKLTNPVLPSDG